MSMTRRQRTKSSQRARKGKFYVSRSKKGRFKKFTSIKRSLAADRRKKSRHKPKRGQGDKGDF